MELRSHILPNRIARSGTGLMYPDHRTPEQKLEADKAKRRKTDALRRAKERVKQQEQN